MLLNVTRLVVLIPDSMECKRAASAQNQSAKMICNPWYYSVLSGFPRWENIVSTSAGVNTLVPGSIFNAEIFEIHF